MFSPGGFQASSTPPELAQAGLQDTNVPDQPVRAGKVPHSHALRYVAIVAGAVGWGLGVWIAKTDNNPRAKVSLRSEWMLIIRENANEH